jgi:hypothetical protein
MLRMALGLTQFFGLLPQWSSDWGVKPTTHFHIVTSLGMGEAIPLLSLYALLAYKGTASIEIICLLNF